jgi:hypothetical protein
VVSKRVDVFNEACTVLELGPKGSAIYLLRKCLVEELAEAEKSILKLLLDVVSELSLD